MEKKANFKFFEALNILNEQDREAGNTHTGNVGQCLQMLNISSHRGGCAVTMGAPEQEMTGIMAGDKIPVLVIIDKKAYEDLQYKEKPMPKTIAEMMSYITDGMEDSKGNKEELQKLQIFVGRHFKPTQPALHMYREGKSFTARYRVPYTREADIFTFKMSK